MTRTSPTHIADAELLDAALEAKAHKIKGTLT